MGEEGQRRRFLSRGAGLFHLLFRSRAPRVSIDVHPAALTFGCEERSAQVETVAFVVGGVESRRIVALGETDKAPDGARRIELFTGEPPSAADADLLMEILVALVQRGLLLVVPGRVALRPVVTLRGLATLDPRLGGFQASLLRSAVRLAGAAEVVIES
jgi:hypothetical protein